MSATTAQAHMVIVDNGQNPPRISFPPAFNTTVAFSDRQVAAGRGDRAALWFTFVSELPKTVTGKIQRFRLRQGEGA